MVAHLATAEDESEEQKQFAHYQTFFAERVPRPEAEAFKATVNKAAKKKNLEKRDSVQ